jgi:hypothetical protein
MGAVLAALTVRAGGHDMILGGGGGGEVHPLRCGFILAPLMRSRAKARERARTEPARMRVRLSTSQLAGDLDPYSRVFTGLKVILRSLQVCSHGSPGSVSMVFPRIYSQIPMGIPVLMLSLTLTLTLTPFSLPL